VFAQGFGAADMATKAAATAQTIYPISSMTKTFTAAAVTPQPFGQLDGVLDVFSEVVRLTGRS